MITLLFAQICWLCSRYVIFKNNKMALYLLNWMMGIAGVFAVIAGAICKDRDWFAHGFLVLIFTICFEAMDKCRLEARKQAELL